MFVMCPHCHKQQKIPAPYKGREVKCLHCKELITAEEYDPPAPVPNIVVAAKILPVKNTPLQRHQKLRNRMLYNFFLLLILCVFISGFLFYRAGNKSGRKEGFEAATEIVSIVSKIRSENPEYQPQPLPRRPPENPCTINSVNFKILGKDRYSWHISWQVKCSSQFTGPIYVYVYFYDKDGFLLHQDAVYNQFVEEYRYYTFSNDAYIEPDIAQKIVFANAKIFPN